MNTVTKSSTVNPGYGYRLLKDGEIIQRGDESLDIVWQDRVELFHSERGANIGEPMGPGRFPTRRKIDVGSGYRLVGEIEVLKEGDQSCMVKYLHEGTWWPISVSMGERAGSAWAMLADPVVARRKVEAPKPTVASPRVPKGTPPAGYRFLVEGEIVQASDAWVRYDGSLEPANGISFNYVGSKVGKHVCDLTDSPFVRKVERTPEPKVFAGEGWRFLKAGERLQRGDEAVHLLHTSYAQVFPEAFGTAVNDADAGSYPEGYYRRKVGVATDLSAVVTKLEGELKDARQQITSMKKNASGNAVLVRTDGFSKPISIPPWSSSAFIAVPTKAMSPLSKYSDGSSFETVSFERTGTTDGFGRTVFKQAA